MSPNAVNKNCIGRSENTHLPKQDKWREGRDGSYFKFMIQESPPAYYGDCDRSQKPVA